jgi:hypothetical protein
LTKSIAEQTEAELGGPRSVLVRQRRDHVRLSELMEAVRTKTGEERDAAVNDMCRLAFPHAFAEEAILWPAIRRALPDGEGEALTLEVEQEHQEINEIIAALERSGPGDPDRESLIERALDLLDTDVRDEEDELLPRLQDASSVADLRRLGFTWELVRRTAPTRPHPVVARRPPGNVLSALPLTAIDRSRDFLDRRARGHSGPLSSVARQGSRSLADLAGAIEHLPPYRRGEDPSTHSGRTSLEG